MSLTESSDNKNVIIDINSSYLNTTTSLSSLFYTQASTNSILSTSYYNQTSTNSLLSSKQGFISSNSTLNLSSITCSTTFTCQGLKVLNNQGQDVLISPGPTGTTNGGSVGITNFASYPIIMQGTPVASTTLTTLTSSWSTLKSITPYQATINIIPYYGLHPNLLPMGFYQSANNGRHVSIDGILALLVGFNQAMYNQLKTAGISGFV